ncbi:hypothetical protein Fcan01_19060 [Folsomia candida]|uniref:Ionotropic glutamate receptor C-terminal domain-containing protein n=1 Tax=Folsomia candida TaxID=158441 RepID=A0A226DKT7_FOLCA|nr:hypothetical protein Fcan01_19060 [Folsomia candida]
MSNFVLDNSKQYKRCDNKSYTAPKRNTHFGQEEIFFIIPAVSQWLATMNFYDVQFQLVSCGENPSIIFFVDRNALTTSFIPIEPRLVGLTSKLFVLGLSNLHQLHIYVFCHTCGSHPLRWIDHNHSDLFKEWKLYNYNLHRMPVLIVWGYLYSRKTDTCHSLQNAGRYFPTLMVCLQRTLNQQYNFTSFDPTLDRPPLSLNKILHVNIWSSHFLSGNSSRKESFFIYHIKIFRTSLTAISLKPSSLVESFEKFLLPLDAPTWIGIIVSVLSIATVIAITKPKSITCRFANSLFWTYACLTGQYGGTSYILRMLSGPKLFIVTSIWFFFFTGAEFYQGALFSSLITTSPPELPASTNALVDSNLQIITTGTVYGDYGAQSTALDMIHDSLDKLITSTNLKTLLIQLRRRSIFISTHNSFMFGVELANSQTFYYDKRTRKLEDTFAVLDDTPRAQKIISGLRSKRTLRLKSFDDVPLFFVKPLTMERTWLFPIISLGIGRLWQCGLYSRWTILEDKLLLLSQLEGTVSGDMLRKTMFQLHSRILMTEAVSDEANPVTLKSLKTMYNLCGLLLIGSLALFLAEGFGPARRKFQGWLLRARTVWFVFILRRKRKRNRKLLKPQT